MNSYILINIGLARKGKPDNSLDDVFNALATHGVSVLQHHVAQSSTEQTFIAAVDLPRAPDTRHAAAHGDLGAVYRTAQQLEQEAIAVFDPAINQGVLVGPKSAAWGEFNPKFFLDLNGNSIQ